MGMYGSFRLARAEQIERLLADPDQLDDFLEETIVPEAEGEREPDTLDVGRAWHGLHYLLCGAAWEGNAPLDFIAHGGRPLGGGEDAPRAFTPEEVQAIARALEPVTSDALGARFDFAEMIRRKIYPFSWKPESLAELLVYFEPLKRLVLRAAQEGMGLVVQVG